MEKLRKGIYVLLSIIAVALAAASILSIFRDTDSRYLKMLDFPRIQFFVSSLIALVLFVIMTRRWQWYDYLLVLCLIVGLGVNAKYLINYTPLVAKAVPSVEEVQRDENSIKLIVVNVKMTNREAQPLLDLLATKDPDLILALETDKWWDEKLQGIQAQYPYAEERINDVAYGMVLYSKFPFEKMEVNYLQQDDVPSFDSVLRLKDNTRVSFHAVHPVPPMYFKKYPDNKGKEEVAMEKIGEKVENRKYPTIVAGDMNDVVWSNTDQLTHTEDLLHDVRVGRGFYNSFNAHNFFMRWPIDHIFVTKEFKVRELERLGKIGSDHFPMYVELVL